MISIVDYGVGNLGSVSNMLKHLGVENRIVKTPDEVLESEKLILPGVGSWDNGIAKLKHSRLLEALNRRVLKDKVPVLGICLGMQLLFDSSEEGELPGLGWIPGKIGKFRFSDDQLKSNKLRIPHMGWNVVSPEKKTPLTQFEFDENRFYFVHSYHVVVKNDDHIMMTSNYGYKFVCGVHNDNIWGVQFHPEKSHKFGMVLMKRFAEQ